MESLEKIFSNSFRIIKKTDAKILAVSKINEISNVKTSQTILFDIAGVNLIVFFLILILPHSLYMDPYQKIYYQIQLQYNLDYLYIFFHM